MSDITMIGLGAMGSALARAFVRAGHNTTVWNRSAARMGPLMEIGARGAGSVTEAVAASPMIVVCINNYAATQALLGSGEVLAALAGRTLVQLSTGTSAEARAAEAWLAPLGVDYIDGAIMPYPSDIGAPDAQILFAGPEAAYRRCLPLLGCLGGDLRYLGTNIAAAAVLDMALLTGQLCNYLGALHGALLCESEGVGVDVLGSMFAGGDPVARLLGKIHRRALHEAEATLTVWNAALDGILDQGRSRSINTEIPSLVSSLFRRALAAGRGEDDVASVIEVLRAQPD